MRLARVASEVAASYAEPGSLRFADHVLWPHRHACIIAGAGPGWETALLLPVPAAEPAGHSACQQYLRARSGEPMQLSR
jgi:hypothetical protein